MGVISLIGFLLAGAGSILKSILSSIPPIGWICIACFIVGIVAADKGCSCRPHFFSEHKPVIRSCYLEVVKVTNGATIEYKKFGKRTDFVFLSGIACPIEGRLLSEESRKNLEMSCGKKVRVEYRRGFLRVGTCFGETGIDLALDQLQHGYAWCLSTAPKEYLKAEVEAKKNKLGIWGK